MATNRYSNFRSLAHSINQYPYFAIILSNHLHVKHKQNYVNNDGTTGAKMWGNGDNSDAQRKTCYSTAVVTTISGNWAGDATYQNAHLDLEGNAVTIVDSGQDEPTFDKTNFGNKTDKFSAIKDFKI